jgi:hypothetical protein
MSSLNLEIAEGDIILPRIVQVLGAGILTVPVTTIIFRFLPKTESSRAAALSALMRNEGGSIGHSACQHDAPTQSATPPFDPNQTHQQLLSRHKACGIAILLATPPLLGGAAIEYLSWWESSDGTCLDQQRIGVPAKRI